MTKASTMASAVPVPVSASATASVPSMITIRQAARRLNLTMNYVYNLIWTGKIKARKVGRQWRIPVKVIEARIKANGNGSGDGHKR